MSEYDAPDDFECIWQMEKKDGLGRKSGKKQNTKVEKLFRLKEKQNYYETPIKPINKDVKCFEKWTARVENSFSANIRENI